MIDEAKTREAIKAEAERFIAEAKNLASQRAALTAEKREAEGLKAGAVAAFDEARRRHDAEIAAERRVLEAEKSEWKERVAKFLRQLAALDEEQAA